MPEIDEIQQKRKEKPARHVTTAFVDNGFDGSEFFAAATVLSF